MSQTLEFREPALADNDSVRKSEIVVKVMTLRSGTNGVEKTIIKALDGVLSQRSLALQHWDGAVDRRLADRIVRHVSAVKGRLSLQALVQDVDILVNRWNP